MSAVVWAASAAVGIVLAAASGIVVLGILVAVLLAGIPAFFAGAELWARQVNQAKAVAAWTRMLSEQTTAGAGLRQAIMDTAERVPGATKDQAMAFARSLKDEAFDNAAAALAEQLQDEEVDVLVAALMMANAGTAGDVATGLREFATDCQQAAESRQRSDTNRTEDRTSARVIAVISVASFAAMSWWNRDMLTALRGPVGQAVLAVGGALFIAGHRLMARMDRPPVGLRHRPRSAT
jgi:hypothetical protein